MLNFDLIPKALIDSSQAAKDLKCVIAQIDTAFNNNEVYPYLSQLLLIQQDLKFVNKHRLEIKSKLGKEADLTSVRAVKTLLEQENVSISKIKQHIEEMFMFIEWASPLIEERVEAGKKICDTVEDSLIFQWENLSSANKLEGFIFINIASNSNDNVKVYHCQLKKLAYKDSHGSYWSPEASRHKDVPLDKPMIVQTQIKNSRPAHQRNKNPDPAMVWVTALEPYSLPKTLEPILKRRFGSRLIKEVIRKQK